LLTVVTMSIHAGAVVLMACVSMSIRVRLESRKLDLSRVMLILICIIGVLGLLLVVVHGIESAIWAAAYLWLGALNSPVEALLFSVDSMTTRGASGLSLPSHWQMMGALEAVDGMLLFGVSTAFVFAVIQSYWSMLAERLTPRKS
jgi:hypothetical protein